MFKSITKKFLFTYMAVTILSLLLIAGGVSHLVKQEIYGQRKEFLEQKAFQVYRLFSMLLEDKISTEYFTNTLNMIQNEDKLGISLIVEDQEMGSIEGFGRKPISSNRSGSVDQEVEKDYFIAYFEIEEEERDVQMMTVSVPLRFNGKLMGEVLIYSPVVNVELVTSKVNKSILLIFIAISIPMTLIIVFVSRKFTIPLIHMSKIANNISKGDFSESITIKGNDEIAELGHSLNHMADKIQELEELRKDSIANVSHELKTPLTTIQNFMQGILDGVVPENQVESFIKIAIDESKRLGKMVEELIVLSSFEKKLVKLNLTTNNIGDLIDDVFLQMDFQLKEKKIVVEKMLDSSITADVDQERFRQMLINILDNAIRHMPYNGKLQVCLEKSLDKNFVLTIVDSGPGIEEEHLPYVFERFYKVDRSRKRTSGAGLGLTISKNIVEAHNGSLSINNDEEMGLRVEIVM
ncbi:sensor histidine kinase [Paratissierella segnis]|uniref:histidine kinase n=1 Tax=Paratissierella segnis TaxID=2763679 RepID=A0A926IG44_9FIRM|nr:HAMP domain-containing sensor histidine kinase [Paratissierella segnis]MBC8589197.1 HAMP domain-containing histidine kinase [Paratissierella segnis]